MVPKENLHTEDFVFKDVGKFKYVTIYLFIKRYQIRFLQQNRVNFNHFRIESFIFKGKKSQKICEHLSRFFLSSIHPKKWQNILLLSLLLIITSKKGSNLVLGSFWDYLTFIKLVRKPLLKSCRFPFVSLVFTNRVFDGRKIEASYFLTLAFPILWSWLDWENELFLQFFLQWSAAEHGFEKSDHP